MNVLDAIKTRKSVRRYLEKSVEKEKLNAVLAAARLAPSANNKQEWRFVVVTDKAIRRQLVSAAKNQTFVGQAPVVIACCAETDGHVMTCGQLCYPIDLAIAIDHMTLAAVEQHLGTCWIGAFYEDQVRELLNIPEHIKVVELLTLGYPEDTSVKQKNRRPLSDIVRYEKW